MDVLVTTGSNSATFTITGEIDENGAQLLKTKFSTLDKSSIKDITFDFANVTHIGSAGIGKLLLFYKDIAIGGGQIKIIHVSDTIYTLLTTLKLDSVFKIDKT